MYSSQSRPLARRAPRGGENAQDKTTDLDRIDSQREDLPAVRLDHERPCPQAPGSIVVESSRDVT
jgi:hypothetical protein